MYGSGNGALGGTYAGAAEVVDGACGAGFVDEGEFGGQGGEGVQGSGAAAVAAGGAGGRVWAVGVGVVCAVAIVLAM